MSQTPAFVHSSLDALDINSDGGLLLAASSLTNRYWVGSLWYFSNPDDAPDVEKCSAGVDCDSGVNDLAWLPGNDRLICGCDSGAVMIWKLTDKRQNFCHVASSTQHDDFIHSIHLNADRTKATSASQDCSIKVWNLEELVAEHSYKAHWDAVLSAVWHPENPNLFISCSKDGRLLLWDLRNSKPASAIETQFLPSLPTCVAWQPGKEHSAVIGTETGQLLVQDIRRGVGTPHRAHPHSRPIHRLCFAHHRSDWLASVSEDSTTSVTSITEKSATVSWQDLRHRDFVRGLSWHPNTNQLYTCGWDTCVLAHTVNPDAPVTKVDKESTEVEKISNMAEKEPTKKSADDSLEKMETELCEEPVKVNGDCFSPMYEASS